MGQWFLWTPSWAAAPSLPPWLYHRVSGTESQGGRYVPQISLKRTVWVRSQSRKKDGSSESADLSRHLPGAEEAPCLSANPIISLGPEGRPSWCLSALSLQPRPRLLPSPVTHPDFGVLSHPWSRPRHLPILTSVCPLIPGVSSEGWGL